MLLLKFCHWLAKTHVSIIMRDGTYQFAVVEVIHLLALAIFGGAILLVDLRFMGFGLNNLSTPKVARQLLPLTAGGALVMLLSGFFLFLGGPVRYYHNPAFQLKIILFVIAIFFHFILQIRVASQNPQAGGSSPLLKAGAVLSLLLWLTIGLAGRAIGYV